MVEVFGHSYEKNTVVLLLIVKIVDFFGFQVFVGCKFESRLSIYTIFSFATDDFVNVRITQGMIGVNFSSSKVVLRHLKVRF